MWIQCWATVCVFITSPSLNALWFARNGRMLRCRLTFFSSSPRSKPLSAITVSSASISPTATLFLSISDPAFFRQMNMTLNDRSHKMCQQIRILSSMKHMRFGHGLLVFLPYNFINKEHANIDTELCTRLNFFDL